MKTSLLSKNYHLEKEFHSAIQSRVSDYNGRVLDVGCGDKPYRDWIDADTYIGIDISANRNHPDVLGDGLRLPFADDSFNYVVSFQVLEHVKDPFKFFSEISRVLKSGGRALITTNQMWNIHMGPHDYFRFTRFGLEELARVNGLETNNFIEIGNLPIRVCIKVNDAYHQIARKISEICPLPKSTRIVTAAILATNVLASPFLTFDTHQDYIIVGAEIRLN